ncbi:thioredoxin fold domain-containing protein [bacterium]|nr:thioredoxin fold domain-containing protein [bacterium]
MRFERFQRAIVTLIMIAFASVAIAASPATGTAPKPGVKKSASARPTPKPKHTPPAVIEKPLGTWKSKLTTTSLASNLSQTKPTFVMISANWCPFCKKMKKDVFPTTTVQAALTNWDLVYIDSDTYPKVAAEAKHRSIPFFVLYDKNHQEVSRFTHEMNADQLSAWTNDVYARMGELDKIDADLKAKPGDPQLLSRRANALVGIALKIQNVDSRITVAMPAHLKAAMDAVKQAQAAGDNSAGLKAQMQLMEIIQQYLNNDLAGASGKLDQFAKTYAADKDLASDAFFWNAVFTMKKNATRGRSHDMESDRMFEDYLMKYPTGRFADASSHRLETVIAAIQKVINDSAKKAKTERAKAAKAQQLKDRAAQKGAGDTGTDDDSSKSDESTSN